jgi:hypothetical protein
MSARRLMNENDPRFAAKLPCPEDQETRHPTTPRPATANFHPRQTSSETMQVSEDRSNQASGLHRQTEQQHVVWHHGTTTWQAITMTINVKTAKSDGNDQDDGTGDMTTDDRSSHEDSGHGTVVDCTPLWFLRSSLPGVDYRRRYASTNMYSLLTRFIYMRNQLNQVLLYGLETL